MNVFLWVLQILLAIHTAMGAMWKFTNSEQSVESLRALPHAVWLGLSGIELLCVVGLLLPAVKKNLGKLVPISAGVIAAEMLLFCVVHLASGDPNRGELVYWLVVAAFSGFVAYGRFVLKPLVQNAGA